VILRGNSRQAIFFDDDDRHRWESMLAEGLLRYGHRVHAYCWMTNHIHMALQCRTEPAANLMRFVASKYARSTNRKMNRSGHLFERRHSLILVQADSYLKSLVRYIHQNPLRAGMVHDLAAYRWSSHLAYLGHPRPSWLTVDWVLSAFGESAAIAHRRYGDFIQQRADETTLQLFRARASPDGRMLGSDAFIQAVAKECCKLPSPQSLDEIIASTCATYRITEQELASKSRARRNARIRAEIVSAAIETNAATLAALARRFNRSESVLCRSLSRLRANKSIS
jgi:REP element-mobilizing transposase RayT